MRVQPTDDTTNTPATSDQAGKPLTDVLNEAAAAAEAERNSREDALYRALRMSLGDERFDACDLIDLAEYIRTGARGVPLSGCAAEVIPSADTFVHPAARP